MDRKIPTPSISLIEIGPVSIHIYALCIIFGVTAAIVVSRQRFRNPDVISDLAIYAIPGGIIGARIYHIITSPDNYLGRNWINALKIWEGGLGIWGAISGGAIVVWYKAKKSNFNFTELADAVAPGLLIAQAIGRFGNWFNAELFGRPTDLPWGLYIPLQNRPVGYENFEFFHPTFLYEAICSLVLAFFLIRMNLKPGGIFALYVLGYCIYRFFIEGLRIDPASLIFGMRVNQLVALIIGTAACARFLKIIR